MRIEIFEDMALCTAEEVQRLLPLVSHLRREQAMKYKHVFGQYCCLKSWLMLKNIIGEVEEWSYNEHGKPFLKNGPFFSISHCKEGIAVAVDQQPIGIDIEAIRHADAELIERVMNREEQLRVKNDRDFTRLWTQKEAILKCDGTGIESFEQLQSIDPTAYHIRTVETEKYIYSIAYKNT